MTDERSAERDAADGVWDELIGWVDDGMEWSGSVPIPEHYMRLREAVEATAREIAREEIRRLQQQVDRIGHRLDYLYRVVLPPEDQEEEESDRDRKDALLYDEYHKRMGLVKEEPEPEAPEEGGDPLRRRYERVKRDQSMRGHHCDYRVALEAELQSRAARTPTVSREQWDALKQAIRTSDTHGRQYAAGLGLTITDHPEADDGS